MILVSIIFYLEKAANKIIHMKKEKKITINLIRREFGRIKLIR